jgi:plastocyanin
MTSFYKLVLITGCLFVPKLLFAQNCTANFTFQTQGLTVQFTDLSTTTGSPIVSWDWDFDDGDVSSQQNPLHTFPDIDNYNVTLTITTANGCSNSITISVQSCDLLITYNLGQTCNPNGQLTLNATISDPFDEAISINVSLDGVPVAGSPFDIDDNAPVVLNLLVPGDGLPHTLLAQSEQAAGCFESVSFTTPDCNSNCFLSSMNISYLGGTPHTVTIGDNFFNPQVTTITIGSPVIFQWSAGGHTSTSDVTTGPDSWNSGELGGGASYTVNITNPGTHRYYCIPHGGPNGAGMSGMIVANCPAGNQFTIEISFNTSIANPAGYQLLIDGSPVPGNPHSYTGTGVNSLTTTIAGDGLPHIITIRDIADPSCELNYNLDAPDCGAAPQCSVSVSAITSGGCTANDQIPYTLTVTSINGSAGGFNVLVDGQVSGNSPYAYANGGVTTVNNILVPGNGLNHTIVIQDIGNTTCNGSTTVTSPNCTIPCLLSQMTTSIGQPVTHTVFVEDFQFVPAQLTIAVGDIVQWVWTGAVQHTTTSDVTTGLDAWNSGLHGNGFTYSKTFTNTGLFPYYCIPHGAPGGVGMSGTITVTPPCNNGNVQVAATFTESGGGFGGYTVLVDNIATLTNQVYNASGTNSFAVPVTGNGASHTITVRDIDDPACFISASLSTPDCNAPVACNISMSASAAGSCNANNAIPYTITVTDVNGGAGGFNLFVDSIGVNNPHTYHASGTTILNNIPVPGDGGMHTIIVTNATGASCADTTMVTTTNCTIPCMLSQLSTTVGAPVKHTINVQDFVFVPAQITIAAGDTIEWVWSGAIQHTSTSDATTGPDVWNSGLQSTGFTYRKIFTNTGLFPYYCIPHGAPGGVGMSGTITVTPPCNNGNVQVAATFTESGGGFGGYTVLVDNIATLNNQVYNASGANSFVVPVTGNGASHTITVRDIDDPACFISATLTTPECNAPVACNISVTASAAGSCNANNAIPYTITVTDVNGGTGGFNLFVDGIGVNNPHTYHASGTTILNNIPVPGDGGMHTIIVSNAAGASCADTAMVTTINCTIPCMLSQLTTIVGAPVKHTINVQDFVFVPAQITIAAGDTIEWVWTGAIQHTSTSDATTGPDAWNSGLQSTGFTYKKVFTNTGLFPYYCIPHGAPGGVGMSGTVTVTPPCNNGNVQVAATFTESGGGFGGYTVLVDNIATLTNQVYNASGTNSFVVPVTGNGASHTITVRDIDDPACFISATLTTPDCNAPVACNISVTANAAGSCNANNAIPYTITVTDVNGGTGGFNLFVDGIGVNNPHTYHASGTTILNNIPVPGDGSMHTIIVSNAAGAICADTVMVTTINCTIPCMLSQLTTIVGAPVKHTINVQDFVFVPAQITIAAGDTIEWVWTGAIQHTSTSDATTGPDVWNSGLQSTGFTYKKVFTNTGLFPYYCIPHGAPGGVGMSGTITVTPPCNNGNVQVAATFTESGGGFGGYTVLVDNIATLNNQVYNASGTNSFVVPVTGNGASHTITVRDIDDPACFISASLSTPDCNAPVACNISMFASAAGSCNANNAIPYTITVTDVNGGTGGFNLFVDGVGVNNPHTYHASGTTILNNIPVPGDGGMHTIMVTNAAGANCSDTAMVTTTMCGTMCMFMNLVSSIGTPATHLVEVKDFAFLPQHISITTGDTVRFFWTGAIQHTTTSDLETGPDTWDSGLHGNGYSYDVLLQQTGLHSYYCIPHGAPGGIGMSGSIQVNPPCNDGQVSVNLQFMAMGSGFSGYKVLVDGVAVVENQPYGQGGETSTIIPVAGDNQMHVITIVDQEMPNCVASLLITTPDCSMASLCSLSTEVLQNGGCQNDAVQYIVDVQSMNGSVPGFFIKIDNNNWNNSPIPYGSDGHNSIAIQLPGDGLSHMVQVVDFDSLTCSDMVNVATPDCTLPCMMSNLVLSTEAAGLHIISVEDFQFDPTNINVSVGDTVRFVWTGAIAHTTTSDATTGNDVWNSGLHGNGHQFDVIIHDTGMHPYYCIPHGAPGGIGMSGMIMASESNSGCQDGLTNIMLQFNSMNGSVAGYNILVDDVALPGNPFDYQVNGINMMEIPVIGDGLLHHIEVIDMGDQNCSLNGNITTLDCNVLPPCSISLNASLIGECMDNEVMVQLMIMSENQGTQGFNVYVDNNLVSGSPFSYAGAMTMLDIEVVGTGFERTFKVVDNEYSDCMNTASLTVPQCGEFCQVHDLVVNANTPVKHIIEVGDFYFNPPVLDIVQGDTIEFIWIGEVAHTTTSDAINGPNIWNSGLLEQGATYQLMLSNTGTFPYYCIPHGGPGGIGMSGVIQVKERCDNDTAYANVSFMVTNGSPNGFNVFVDGILAPESPFLYNDPTGMNSLLVKVPGDELLHTLTVQDLDNPVCAASEFFQSPYCEAFCAILDLQAATGESVVHIVEVKDFEFDPEIITVGVGETVRFIWVGEIPHSTTSDAIGGMDSWDSGIIGQGAVYDIMIMTPGEHPYYCIPHGGPGGIGMSGVINAVEPCENDSIAVTLNFTATNGDPGGYNIYLDGEILPDSPFAYDNTAGSNTNTLLFHGDGMMHFITVQDIATDFCAATTQIMLPLCEDCMIPDITVDFENAATHIVEVEDFIFSPASIEVTVGDTIQFVWTGAIPHSTTSDATSGLDTWNSGILEQGDTYTVVIHTAGDHPYYCIPHGSPGGVGMAGIIHALPACNGGMVQGNVIFESEGGSEMGFNLYVDAVLYPGSPFPYNNAGITSLPVMITGDGDAHVFDIVDVMDLMCTASVTVVVPDCSDPCFGFEAGYTYDATANTFSFMDMTTESPNSWFWSFGDGNNSYIANPVYTFNTTGAFTVCLIARDTILDCFDSYCSTVMVTMVGADEIDDPDRPEVYPNILDKENPVLQVRQKGISGGLKGATLADTNGGTIFLDFRDNQDFIQLPSGLPPGLYYLDILLNDKNYYFKIVLL